MTPFAKWAVALLIIMLVTTSVGAALIVSDTVSVTAGVGAGLAALGVTSGIASRWMGDS